MEHRTENSNKMPVFHVQKGCCSCRIQTEMPVKDSKFQADTHIFNNGRRNALTSVGISSARKQTNQLKI